MQACQVTTSFGKWRDNNPPEHVDAIKRFQPNWCEAMFLGLFNSFRPGHLYVCVLRQLMSGSSLKPKPASTHYQRGSIVFALRNFQTDAQNTNTSGDPK